MKQRNYCMGMAKMGLHQLETARNEADREEGWQLVSWSGITNTEWFHEATKVVAAEEAYYRPSSKWCKLFDNLCSAEIQKTGLNETGYIKAKLKEVRALGARARDFRLVHRMLSLPGFEMR